jgi:glutaredoxin
MTDKPIKITLFHATWCSHCHSFMKTWKNELIKDKDALKNIEFVAYEAEQLKSLSKSEKTINGNEIEGFPTIRITINGSEHNYMGKRTTGDIYRFILGELKKTKKEDDPTVVELTDRLSDYPDDPSMTSDNETSRRAQQGGNKNRTRRSLQTIRRITKDDLKILNKDYKLSDVIHF